MVIKGVSRLLLCMSLLSATASWAADIHGRSSTQFLTGASGFTSDRRQNELDEYLRLSITNIDPAGKFSLQGYGRIGQDFGTGEGLNGRLYYLYGEYRDLYDKVDFRLGRQFVNLAAGSAIIDGVQVDLRNVGPVAFTVLGGRDVLFGFGGETGDPANTAFGLAAYLAGFKKTDAEISWFRKWDNGDNSRDQLGGNFRQQIFNSLQLYANARYDLVSETFNEVQAGVKFFPTSSLLFTGEYFQSYPIFDTTSIYSVFAVDRYQEGVLKVNYRFNEIVSVYAGITREEFGEGGGAFVWQAGTVLRPIEPLGISVEYDARNGYYGKTNGIISDVTFDITKNAQVAGGIDFDVYQRDSMTGDEYARRYYLAGKYRLAKNLAVSGRIQDDVNVRYTKNISGRFVLDYDF
ncbi:hypothetical protein GMLC_31340 [Geomonas limicola]|uniref:Outer membrane channel protein n=1 Tax=Geomonas limicola TaxID=2740186 RepID=A0A6V8NAB0_9BACT|nr:hypothetical protein [Geomonas limicola]GFO69555.1 hypothetical protein GMLC_31340 [Geomonas limicola]